MIDMCDSDDTQWLTDREGEIAVGIRRAVVDGRPVLSLYLPDGQRVGSVTEENAGLVVEMLQTGVAFAEIVGDERFALDLSDLP